MTTKLWECASLSGGAGAMKAALLGTPWESYIGVLDDYRGAVERQDRGVLDQVVPDEMAVYCIATHGAVAYRTDNGRLHSWDGHGGEPVPAATLVWMYGGALIEDLFEKGTVREPDNRQPDGE